MKTDDYLEIRKELISGQERRRSKAYPLLLGAFTLMIIVNVAMLVMNNL